MSSPWIGSEWVGRVIDGRFTLERWLGGAAQSGVFLTHLPGDTSQKAAIKLVSGDATDAGALLEQWTAATQLSHPNILRMFQAGRDRIEGRDLLYAVTEYSEEILAEILAVRALTPAEVRELLEPVLGTLSWLHIQGLVHGGVKPSNIMVVNDQLKLSVDRIQPAGPTGLSFPSTGVYSAPGTADKISPAADVWSLGALLVEVLTQRPPRWENETGDPVVPRSVPEPYGVIARECLHTDPAHRCTLSQILSQLEPLPVPEQAAGKATSSAAPVKASAPPSKPAPTAPPIPPAIPVASPTPNLPPAGYVQPSYKTFRQRSNEQSFTIFAIAALFLLAGIAALTFIVPAHKSSPHSVAPHSAGTPAPEPSTPAPAPRAATSGPAGGAVLHRVLPDVPRDALNTIRGNVRVEVRVKVSADGKVSSADFQSRGPSHYFAGLALDAARNWTFEPARAGGSEVPSSWLLQFDFARSGVNATAVETAH